MKRMIFIAGMQRSGTTYLANVLDAHPEIYFARPIGGPAPEPKFFINDSLYAKGKDFYIDKYFKNRNEPVFGEKSVIYAEHPSAPERLFNFFPDALVLFILRDPVERAISNYFLSVRSETENRSIEEALFSDAPVCPERVAMFPYYYIRRGSYCSYLRRYERFENIHILIAEEILNNLSTVRELYKHIGVDPTFSPACITKKFNEANRTPVAKSIVEKLRKIYEPRIKELEDYMGRDLNIWLNK